jgi:4a-hydroxytetrahydrobiopterin dehydratase
MQARFRWSRQPRSSNSRSVPEPEVKEAPLTEEQLDAALQTLPGWEPVESYIPRDYPRSRHELRRAFRFKTFRGAIEFMSSMVVPVNKAKHHPRLENQWRTVIVHLSTWDIGQKISRLDIELAHTIDAPVPLDGLLL